MKALIFAYCSPEYNILSCFSIPNHARYAYKNGYDYICLPCVNSPAMWKWQLEQVKTCLGKFDAVMAIDMDAIFTNDAIRIEDRCGAGDSVVMSHEPLPNKQVNAGVVIWNRNDKTLALLNLLLEHADEWMKPPLFFQGWLTDHLDHPIVAAALKVLPPRAMTAAPGIRAGYPQDDIEDVWHPGDWVMHCYGMKFVDRFDFITKGTEAAKKRLAL